MNTWKRVALSSLPILLLGLAPLSTALAQVRVTAATPSSTYQGTVSLDVIVSGSGFDPSAQAQYLVSGTTASGGIVVKKVVFHNPKEIVTTIDVPDGATVATFDIKITLVDGRVGKGTSLFAVQARTKNTTPTYPPARDAQGFTSNGGTTAATSRLYMFGGRANGGALGDLWVYANAGPAAAWTYIPGGTSYPSARSWLGWSCGGGLCVAANGISASYKADTWIFSESTRAWSQVSCGRKVFCPSARAGSAMAYDPVRDVHVMFGGETNNVLLADTYTFNAVTRTWTQFSSGTQPPAREAAAATFVPNVGVVMSGGWGNPCCVTTLNDMYVWDGAAWSPVSSTVVSDPPQVVPRLANHSMAWDSTGGSTGTGAMIVTGGVHDSAWRQPNTDTWHVTFARLAGAWQATWTLVHPGCQSAAGSSDSSVHTGAKMAFDSAAHLQVLFGGEDPGLVFYDNTVQCY